MTYLCNEFIPLHKKECFHDMREKYYSLDLKIRVTFFLKEKNIFQNKFMLVFQYNIFFNNTPNKFYFSFVM